MATLRASLAPPGEASVSASIRPSNAGAIQPPLQRPRYLTPVRIRGKKRREIKDSQSATAPSPATKRKHAASSSVSSSARSSPQPRTTLHTKSRPSTPLHHRRDLHQMQYHPSRGLPYHHKMHPRTSMSPLESLPPEILQQIFLLTCNISLPQASPLLGIKLSDKHVYHEFFMSIFCQFDVYESGNPWRMSDRIGFSEDEYSDAELEALRKAALKCRWITWERFRESRLNAVDQERRRYNEELTSRSSQLYVRTTRNTLHHKHNQPPRQPWKYWSPPAKISTTSQRKYHMSGLELYLGPTCTIPSRLLKWPYQENSFRLLRDLIHLGAHVDASGSLDYEVLEDLWYKAAIAHDYRVVHTLVKLIKPSKKELDTVLDAADDNLAIAWLVIREVPGGMLWPLADEVTHDAPRCFKDTFRGDSVAERTRRGIEGAQAVETALTKSTLVTNDEEWRQAVDDIVAELDLDSGQNDNLRAREDNHGATNDWLVAQTLPLPEFIEI